MWRRGLVYFTLSVAGMAAPAAAQRPDSAVTAMLAPGIVHRRLLVGQGPWSVNVVEVDLRIPGISVRGARADDKLRGRETVSSMVRRRNTDSATVVAAINADFFNLKTGEDENNQVIEGEIWKGVPATWTPNDTGHHVHSQFAVAGSGRPLIEQLVFRGTVIRTGGARVPLDAINNRGGSTGAVLYTSRIGATTPWDSAGATVDVRLRYVASKGDTSIYQVTSYPLAGGTASLDGGPVLSFPISLDTARNLPHPGETIRIQTNLQPAPLGLRTVVGGWPRLVVHGASVADTINRAEGGFSKSFAGRNPRTGVGFSRDSTTLYLITVDGRQEGSDGMSLTEFADFMIRIGVYEGLNLDGGGSTAMVINGALVNTPSDKANGRSVERTVGNALLVVMRKP